MRVLLTGATGYIGRRLMERLAAENEISLRVFVRNAAKLRPPSGSKIEIAEGSTFDRASLVSALANVETAYYLVHSMGAKGGFPELERRSAENFRGACLEAGVGRIIYLGGLGVKDTASRHLRSRIETGEILSARPDKIRTLWFRAGIIIGSGSASFEIIRHLVQKLPVMITPRWIKTSIIFRDFFQSSPLYSLTMVGWDDRGVNAASKGLSRKAISHYKRREKRTRTECSRRLI